EFLTPPSSPFAPPSTTSHSATALQSARPSHIPAPHTSELPSASRPSQIAGTPAHTRHPRRSSESNSRSRAGSIPDAQKTPESLLHPASVPTWRCHDKARGRSHTTSCAYSTRHKPPARFPLPGQTPPQCSKSHPQSIAYPPHTPSPAPHPTAPRNNPPAAKSSPTYQSTPATPGYPCSSPVEL